MNCLHEQLYAVRLIARGRWDLLWWESDVTGYLHPVTQFLPYTQSHIKSDQPGSQVFRRFLGQLSNDFHEIW